MSKIKVFQGYFWVVGIYDVILGGAFLLFYKSIYGALGITLANHPGYVYLPSLFLISGGIGEFLIAKNPLRNVDLVVVRLLMKLSFVLVVFYYQFKTGIPLVFTIIAGLSVIGILKNLAFLSWAKSEQGHS